MPGSGSQPVHRPPGEGDAVPNPLGGTLRFKVRGDQSDGGMSAFESVAAPGEGPPLHMHVDADEVFYALEGSFRFKLAGEVRPAPAGSFVFIPRRVAHTWQNVGDEPARLLAIFTPAALGMERFFERYAALPEGEAGPEAFRRLGHDAGMEVVGLPLAESDPL